MKIDTNYIEKLAKILNENGLSEIALEDEDCAITLRKNALNGEVVVPAIKNMQPVIEKPITANEEVKAEAEAKTERKAITSPMVGTFYAASAPDAAPMVQVGDTVKSGDVVCIIEAMKLMNEIQSEVSGKIVEICVENGQPIEFGQVLMYVE